MFILDIFEPFFHSYHRLTTLCFLNLPFPRLERILYGSIGVGIDLSPSYWNGIWLEGQNILKLPHAFVLQAVIPH
jgi:hypothetical protein